MVGGYRSSLSSSSFANLSFVRRPSVRRMRPGGGDWKRLTRVAW